MCNQSAVTRTWGFRFPRADGFALVAFGIVASACQRVDSPLWWLTMVVAAHFFLFCNVFRVRRRRELLWAAILILNVGLWVWCNALDWFNVLACQLPVSVGILAWEIQRPEYHGICASRINPRLNKTPENSLDAKAEPGKYGA